MIEMLRGPRRESRSPAAPARTGSGISPSAVWPETETLSWREAERELEAQPFRALTGAWLERGEWHAHPDVADEPVPGPRDACSRRSTASSTTATARRRSGASATGWRCTSRRRSASTATTCCRCLAGDEVVGRAEPRFDRKTRTLELLGAWGDTSRLDEALGAIGRVAGRYGESVTWTRTECGGVPVPAASSSCTTTVPGCSCADLVGHVHRVGAAAARAAAGGRERLADHLALRVEHFDGHVRLEHVRVPGDGHRAS